MGDLAVSAAAHGFDIAVHTIQRIHQNHIERKQHAHQRAVEQQHFLHQFSHVGAPQENPLEDYTIQAYCKGLRDLVSTHLDVILGRGRRNVHSAHAFMAMQAVHMGAMAGLPRPAPPPPLATPTAVTRSPHDDRVDA